MSEKNSNKYLSFVKSELSGQFDDLRISSAEKVAEKSSSTYASIVIAVWTFLTWISFIVCGPHILAFLHVYLGFKGNPILFGYATVLLFHLVVLILLVFFRKSLLQKKVYNKVFEGIINMGNK